MQKRIFFIVCVQVFLNFIGSVSANENIRFEHVFERLNLNDRPAGLLPFVVQDKSGIMWFGGDSVYRFDGSDIKDYSSKMGVCSSFLSSMVVDELGVVWVSTVNNMCFYDAVKDAFVALEINGEIAEFHSLGTLGVSPNNEIYVGLINNVKVVNSGRDHIRVYELPINESMNHSSNQIQDFHFESAENVWFGTTSSGLVHFSVSDEKYEFYMNKKGEKEVLPNNDVRTVAQSEDGDIWIGMHHGGISRMKRDTKEFLHYSKKLKDHDNFHINVWHLMFDKAGLLWVNSDGGGLTTYDVKLDRFTRYTHQEGVPESISSNKTISTFEDQDENIWVSSFPYGVNLINRKFSKVQTFQHSSKNEASLNDSGVLCVFIDSAGNTWVGTEQGLNLFDKDTHSFVNYSKFSQAPWSIGNSPVTTIGESPKGVLWFGTWGGGLYRVSTDSNIVEHYFQQGSMPNSAEAIGFWDVLPGKDETYFAANGPKGIFSYNNNTKSFSQNIFKSNGLVYDQTYTYSLLKDRSGNLWLGSIGGLYRLDEFMKLSAHSADIDTPNTISSHRIRTLYEAHNGDIWIGTDDNGVYRYRGDVGEFQKVDLGDKNPSKNVTCIDESSDHVIWLFTTNGIVLLNPEDYSSRLINGSQGLISSNFNRGGCLITDDDLVFAGASRGLSVFNSIDVLEDEEKFPVLITEFKLFSKSGQAQKQQTMNVVNKDRIQLEYDQKMFSIAYAGLNYPAARWNDYFYKLENFDAEWNSVSRQKVATYTNLPPGNYRFLVKSRSSGGVWSSNEDSLIISIATPPWETWWAYLSYVTLFCVCIFYFIKFKIDKNEREKAEVFRQEKDRLDKERETMRRNFIADVSHELKTPLSILTGEIGAISDGMRPFSKPAIDSLRYEVEIINKLVEDLFDMSLADVGGLHYDFKKLDIISVISQSLAIMNNKLYLKNITVHNNYDKAPVYVSADKERVFQLFINLLENTCRYTDEGGDLEVSVVKTDDTVTIILADSKPGVPPNKILDIFQRFYRVDESRNRSRGGSGLGLSICKSIADAHNAEINASHSHLGGVSISVKFLILI